MRLFSLALLASLALSAPTPLTYHEGITGSLDAKAITHNCQAEPATPETGCQCRDPNDHSASAKCSRQPDGECKIKGHDGWGTCSYECCVDQPSELVTAILVDVGSTKSEPHIYSWPNHTSYNITERDSGCGKLKPGLASFVKMPLDKLDAAIADYLKPLTDCLARTTDAGTRVHVYATGGMRMLTGGQADAIWLAVHRWMAHTKFAYSRSDGDTISGNQEGVFAYLNAIDAVTTPSVSEIHEDRGKLQAVLYDDERENDEEEKEEEKMLMGQLDPSRPHWLGIIDMGGASLQVSFTPRRQTTVLQDSYPVILPAVRMRANVYSTSYQRFGQDAAMARYVSMLQKSGEQAADVAWPTASSAYEQGPTRAACFNKGFNGTMMNADGAKVQIVGVGDYAACREQVQGLLGLDCECLTNPCAMHGVYQPSVEGVTFFAGATFFYTINGLKDKSYSKIDGAYRPTPEQIMHAGESQCALPYETAINGDKFGGNYCFSSAYINAVLEAMRIPSDSTQIVYTVKVPPGSSSPESFDWARGAQLHLNTMQELYQHKPLEPNNWGSI